MNSHSQILDPKPEIPQPVRWKDELPRVPKIPSSASESLNPQPSTINSLNSGPHASVRAQLAIETTPDTADADVLHIRASDETLDRYKEVIVASGWRLENYRKNPVIQNAHQYGDIVFTIGRAEKTWVSGNALLQTWRFASNENPFAKIARDLYRGKFLQAASVGFIPIKWEDPGSTAPAGSGSVAGTLVPRRRYIEQELIEVSAVGIPANPNALTLALDQGAIDKSDLREMYDLLSHLVGRGVPTASSPSPLRGEGQGEVSFASVPSVFKQPAFELLARQIHDLARILNQPSTTNRKENQ